MKTININKFHFRIITINNVSRLGKNPFDKKIESGIKVIDSKLTKQEN